MAVIIRLNEDKYITDAIIIQLSIVSGFLLVLRFPPPIKLTATI